LKYNINLGAYGWRQQHWLNTFYPEDLPADEHEDWRLTYYSNDFSAVLVPSDYWQTNKKIDCEGWLENVHDSFQFFVECHVSMFDHLSLSELTGNLKKLQPQLSALVFIDDNQQISGSVKSQLYSLVDSLGVDVFGLDTLIGAHTDLRTENIWRPDVQQENQRSSSFAYIENDLSDLRLVRKITEEFAAQLENIEQQPEKHNGQATIIVDHPQLQASDLSKFRSLLEIMGY